VSQVRGSYEVPIPSAGKFLECLFEDVYDDVQYRDGGLVQCNGSVALA
jgi:hypothetical protein